MQNKVLISEMDTIHLELIRKNVDSFIADCSKRFDSEGKMVLDIAPQVYVGARSSFTKSVIKTLDIDPSSNADFIADLCADNSSILLDESFDVIICTEVLEHTLNPFDAVKELYRLTKKGGVVCISAPFNFRIHGPLPDCWRFTEHGLKELFKRFGIIELSELKTKDRDLMPIHYTLVAIK